MSKRFGHAGLSNDVRNTALSSGRELVPQELKARSQAAFDRQAATYDQDMQGSHARRLYPLVLDEVMRFAAARKAPRILDMGCGTGALAELVLQEVPEVQLTGIDLSSAMVERASCRLAGAATVLRADAEALPFQDGSFDIVYCNDSFHHYPDPVRAAFQAWRVLAADGVCIVGDVWQPAPARSLMNAWMPLSHEGDVRIYSETELRDVLGTWFEHVRWRRVGMTACLAVARKG
ncbi:class I SAM-dependent methyltransferase [Collinsella sp. An2]|uniref:class I SAM-dependent methyltransferase n=1 Tax=Collinsella sp. An2 TaxID=1965585 RepID=UPI000B377250|nr:class I SAM-dependent methyltransferase [Collinsella sp. An2]OUP08959.1 SAM-dependent methyltransferase [Collinsella sp. An2]